VTDETRSPSGVRIDDRGWGRYLDIPLACPRNRVRYIGIQIDVAAGKPDRVFAHEALQLRMVVARPIVTPSASLTRKSTSPPMRVSAMRPSVPDARRADTAVEVRCSIRRK